MDVFQLAVQLKAFDDMSRVVNSAVNNAISEYAELQNKVTRVSAVMDKASSLSIKQTSALAPALRAPIRAFGDLNIVANQSRTALAVVGRSARALDTVDAMASRLSFRLPNLASGFTQLANAAARAAGKAVSALGQMRDKISEVSSGMQKAGAIAMAGGVALTAPLLKPINAYGDLEDAVTRAQVAFLTVDGLDKGFGAVQKVAEDLGSKLPGTTTDFTIMASKLKELGLATTTIAKGGLEATAYLRVLMGNLAPEAAAELTATFKTALGIAESDFVRFVDLVQRQKFAFGVDPTDFAYTLKYIGPQLKQLGLAGFENSKKIVTFTGALSQAGVKSEQLGTALRGVISALPGLDGKIAKSKELSAMLSKAGISLQFFGKGGQFLGVENLVVQLEKLKVLNPQQRLTALNELFGTEAATAMAEAVSLGVDGYNQAAVNLARQATLQARLNLVMGTLRNLWEAFTGTLNNAFAAIGESIGPDLKNLTIWLNGAAERLTAFAKAHPQLVRNVVLGTAALGGLLIAGGSLLMVLGVLGHGLAGAIGLFAGLGRVVAFLGPRLGAVAATSSRFGAWLAGLRFPAGMFAAAQHALVGFQLRMALSLAVLRQWVAGLSLGRIFAFFGNGLRAMGGSALTAIVTGLKAAALAARGFAVALLGNPVTWVVLAIAGAGLLIWKYWQPLSGFFRGLWAGIREGAAPLAQMLAPSFRALGTALSPLMAPLKAAWGWVTNLLKPVQDVGGASENLGRRWGRVIGGMLVAVTSLPSKLYQAGVTMMTMLWKGIQSLASKPAEAMAGAMAMVRRLLPSSPAKDGPLRDIHRLKFTETIALSVRPAPLVSAMTRTVAATRMAALPVAASMRQMALPIAGPMREPRALPAGAGAGGAPAVVTVQYSPTINIHGGSPQAKADLEAWARENAHTLLRLIENAQATKRRTAY